MCSVCVCVCVGGLVCVVHVCSVCVLCVCGVCVKCMSLYMHTYILVSMCEQCEWWWGITTPFTSFLQVIEALDGAGLFNQSQTYRSIKSSLS